MKKIKVVTPVRGFLNEMFETEYSSIRFIYEKSKSYETNSKIKLLGSKVISSKIFDYLGIIQRIKVNNSCENLCFSYNKFLKTKTPYVIYLENPLALVHYSTKRYKTFLSKKKLNKYFSDNNLKAIICLSAACKETLRKYYEIPKDVVIQQIYPLIYEKKNISMNEILNKSKGKHINCLFISSQFKLKGGDDILEAFAQIRKKGYERIHLTIITKISELDASIKTKISSLKNVFLYDFNFDKEQLFQIYKSSNILLNPTRQDSFSLVVLESMKAGCTIISSDLYAINEMIIDNYNGYLLNPKYRFWDYNNMPNEYVWNNREKTIRSTYIDNMIVSILIEKIIYLYENRNRLGEMSINSFNKANSKEFSSSYIKNEWTKVYNKINKNEEGSI